MTTTSPHRQALGADDALATCPIMPNYGPPPVSFARGDGTLLFDIAGKRYLDFLGGLAVIGIGHAHPAVTEAVARQAGAVTHVCNYFATPPMGQLAVALDELKGGGGQLFFGNSGAEANEAAIKLARKWGGGGAHGRFKIVSTFGGFHGRTLGSLAATGQPQKHEPFMPLPEGFSYAEWGSVDDVARLIDEHTAAVMVEPLQGEAGVQVPPDGYLTGLRNLCDEHGLLLILDEVQAGMARTGNWWGFEHDLGSPLASDAVRPDIVTMAKALANGMPIGACWARVDIAAAFQPGDHGSTFGGNPVSCAAALAVIETMKEIDAPTLARQQGERLQAGLADIAGIESVRGRGLLLAAEVSASALAGRETRDIYLSCLDAGLVVNAVSPTALRFAPPLTVSDDEIDEALSILDSVLNNTESHASSRAS